MLNAGSTVDRWGEMKRRRAKMPERKLAEVSHSVISERARASPTFRASIWHYIRLLCVFTYDQVFKFFTASSLVANVWSLVTIDKQWACLIRASIRHYIRLLYVFTCDQVLKFFFSAPVANTYILSLHPCTKKRLYLPHPTIFSFFFRTAVKESAVASCLACTSRNRAVTVRALVRNIVLCQDSASLPPGPGCDNG